MIAETRAFRGFYALLLAVAGLAATVAGTTTTYGQMVEGQNASDIWYRSHILNKLAEEQEEDGDLTAALNTYNEAKPLLTVVAEQFPNFHSDIVKGRLRMIAEKQRELRAKMSEKGRPKQAPRGPEPGETQVLKNGEFAGGATGNNTQGNTTGPRTMPNPRGAVVPPIIQTTPTAPTNYPSSTVPPTTYLQKGGSIVEQLVEQERERESRIRWQNQQIDQLNLRLQESERRFNQSQVELNRALSVEKQLKANSVSAGDIAEWERLFQEVSAELDTSNALNKSLLAELKSSRQEVASLKQQVHDLRKVRDSAINRDQGGEGLSELVAQNEELRNQVEKIQKYAETVQELDRKKGKEIVFLKKELDAVSKKWQSVKELNEGYQLRIAELQNQLTAFQNGLNAEEALMLGDANPVVAAENDLLQGVVVKQLQRQAQRKMATDLLLAQLDKVGARTDALDAMIEDIATSATYTETEKKLFKGQHISELIADAEARAINYQPPAKPKVKIVSAEGNVQEQKLSKELAQIQKSARLDFVEGRFAEAEKGYKQYLKYRPNKVPCLCNLALVQITVKRYKDAQAHLEKAISLQSDSGFAHYLLGRTYFVQGMHDDALTSLETGLTHNPKNAKAHNFVGVIASQKGWVDRAEDSFNEAVMIDPAYGDAHFNLAVLFATRDDASAAKAKEHYFKALHLGVPRDAAIETFLKQHRPASEISIGMVRRP